MANQQALNQNKSFFYIVSLAQYIGHIKQNT